ncbi:MAG: hypothetical protein AAB036_07195 [Elusimicrobiota bacterium]
MRHGLPARAARRLLERLKRRERQEATAAARDEAQIMLFERHLALSRRKKDLIKA